MIGRLLGVVVFLLLSFSWDLEIFFIFCHQGTWQNFWNYCCEMANFFIILCFFFILLIFLFLVTEDFPVCDNLCILCNKPLASFIILYFKINYMYIVRYATILIYQLTIMIYNLIGEPTQKLLEYISSFYKNSYNKLRIK